MKTLIKLSGLFLVFLSACSTSFNTTAVYDDIYYSRSHAQKLAEIAPTAAPDHIQAIQQPAPAPEINNQGQPYETDNYTDPSENTYIANNYYADEMYQDYHFSSRIRRFHRNWATFGYYDPFFSSIFWYNFNPYYYGTSIYFYDPFFSFGYGWPSYYYSWGYRPWGWAHYGYGWGFGRPWGSFWAGHNYGYWHGYHHGYWYGSGGYIRYPSTDRYVFGARRPNEPLTGFGTREPGRYRGSAIKTNNVPLSGSAGVAGGGRYGTTPGRGDLDERVRTTEAIGGEVRNTGPENEGRRIGDPGINSIVPEERGAVAREPRIGGDEGNQDVIGQEGRGAVQSPRSTERFEPRRNPEDFARPERAQQGQQQAAPRYARPNQEGNQPANVNPNQERTRTYTSPSQQQPRSNQEYRRPIDRPETTPHRQVPQRPEVNQQRPEQSRPMATPQRQAPEQRPQAVPQRQAPEQRPQATPQRQAPQQRPQATPQRQRESRPQAAPARAPQREYAPSSSGGGSSSRSSGGGSSVSPSRSAPPPSSSGGSSGGSSSRSSGGSSSSGSQSSGSSGRIR